MALRSQSSHQQFASKIIFAARKHLHHHQCLPKKRGAEVHTCEDGGTPGKTKLANILSHQSSINSNTKAEEDVAADDSTISHHDLALAKLEGRDR